MITDLPWDLEERVEDAFVAHLKNAAGAALVIAAREVIEVRYPLVVVDAQTSDNKNDDALFNGMRRLSVVVAIVTQALPNSDVTARETHRAVKSAVIEALASNELQTYLNAVNQPGVQFSAAHMTAQTRDAGDNLLTTEQVLDVLAAPKAI